MHNYPCKIGRLPAGLGGAIEPTARRRGKGGTYFRRPAGGRASRPGRKLMCPAGTTATSAPGRPLEVANLTPLTLTNTNQHNSTPFPVKFLTCGILAGQILTVLTPFNGYPTLDEFMKGELDRCFGLSGG